MSQLNQLRKILGVGTSTQTGEVIGIDAPMYRVDLAGTTVLVPLAVGIGAGLSVGDWVAVSGGAIIARVKPLSQLPSYSV